MASSFISSSSCVISAFYLSLLSFFILTLSILLVCLTISYCPISLPRHWKIKMNEINTLCICNLSHIKVYHICNLSHMKVYINHVYNSNFYVSAFTFCRRIPLVLFCVISYLLVLVSVTYINCSYLKRVSDA